MSLIIRGATTWYDPCLCAMFCAYLVYISHQYISVKRRGMQWWWNWLLCYKLVYLQQWESQVSNGIGCKIIWHFNLLLEHPLSIFMMIYGSTDKIGCCQSGISTEYTHKMPFNLLFCVIQNKKLILVEDEQTMWYLKPQ